MRDENKSVPSEGMDDELIEDLEPLESPPKPPRIAPPSLGVTSPNPIQSSLSSDDVEFIGKVFAQVRHVDFKAPAPEGNPRLTGIDKKLFGLREQVRKLERDLSRVSFVWSLKQSEIDSAADWVRAKDEELIRAKNQLNETSGELSSLEAKLSVVSAEAEAEKNGLNEKIADLEDESRNLKLNLLTIREELDKEREDWATEIESARDSAEKRLSQASDEIQRSQRAYDALKGLSQSEKEAHSLQQQSLRVQNAELQERLTQVEIREIEIQRNTVHTAAALKQRDAELEANSKTVLLLQTQLAALEAASKETTESATQASGELRYQLETLQQAQSSHDLSMADLKAELKAALMDGETAQGRLSEVENHADVLQQRNTALAKEHSEELLRQRTTFEQAKAVYSKDTHAAEHARRELGRELEEARSRLVEQVTKSDGLEAELQDEQMANLKLGSKMKQEQELNHSNLETIQMLQSKLREANQSLTESQSGFVELKARLDSSESDKSALVRRLADLEN